MAKLGANGHDIGLKIIAREMMKAGIDVVYLGKYQTPSSVIKAAIEEDVDVIGLSFHAGDHLELLPPLLQLLKKEGVKIPVIIGGVIPPEDVPLLQSMGVRKVFLQGTLTDEVINDVKGIIKEVTSKPLTKG